MLTTTPSPPRMRLTGAASGVSTDTGISHAALSPGASVVDSIATIASLRAGALRYRSAVGAGAAAPFPRLVGGGQLHLKLPGVQPSDLPPGFLAAVSAALSEHNTGLQVVGAYVRKGCIELTLDLMERRLGPGEPHPAAGPPSDLASHEELDLPAIVLSALGVPPPVAGVGGSAGAPVVLVQCGGDTWGVRWDADAMQWQLSERPASAAASVAGGQSGGGGSRLAAVTVTAPLALYAPVQLDAGPGAARRFTILVSGPDLDFGLAASAASSGLAVKPAGGAAGPVTIIAKANGRTAVASVLSARRGGASLGYARGAGAEYDAAPQLYGSAAAGAVRPQGDVTVVELDLDVGYLSAGRPTSSLGLVVRLELWSSTGLVLGTASLAMLRDGACVRELLAMEAEWARAGDADPQSPGFLSPAAQREETVELLLDLGAWLDFAAFALAPPAAAAGPSAVARGGSPRGARAQAQAQAEITSPRASDAEPDSVDLSDQVRCLYLEAGVQPTFIGAGRHLLRHFLHDGRLELARAIYRDLAAATGAAGAIAPDDDEEGADAGAASALTLLHRSVRSGRREVVEQALAWQAAAAADGPVAAAAASDDDDDDTAEAAPPPTSAWAARGPDRLTPLHLLAVDARCGESDAEGQEAARGIEALLRWVMGAFPDAVTVWHTARDASGSTPAALWATLGGEDLLVAAAAEALAAERRPEEAGSSRDSQTTSDGSTRALAGLFSTATATATMEPAPAPFSTAAAAALASAPSTSAAPASSSSELTPPTATATGPDEPFQDAAPLPPRAASITGSPGPAQLLRLAWTGFPSAAQERRYLDFVTLSSAPSTLLWLVIMVFAHAAAFLKSISTGDARQALIGGTAYVITLALMLVRPRLYGAWRERLMLACLSGRCLCRFLICALPSFLHMSDSVIKYVHYGLDVLLDGFLEGTFEPIRVPHVLLARIIEWPGAAGLIYTHGVRTTYGAALLRASLPAVVGFTMTAFMDVRSRAAFLRAERARLAAGVNTGSAAGVVAGKAKED
ncbi:hypothetical protein HYH03_013952 [Edaphochlamys debaryana]|uniref:Uncharacterized protein n=1 Tax=Edaphochlamys debaryana TaxID=47281 RepID=A0A835XNM8_9CHLO|nr:hypothetical protein HYH03_013952 [Edaphochlamys debaryana]|eukprot:KAG2487383.1 hypothetical protein HYH03_013952 [Edaphochlamys debaryana]